MTNTPCRRRMPSVCNRSTCASLHPLEPRLLLSAATHLVFLNITDSLPAGLFPPIQIAVEDAYGNIVRDTPFTITLYNDLYDALANQPPADFGSDPILGVATSKNGIATFSNVAVTNRGDNGFGASALTVDGNTAINGVSTTFNVIPNTTLHFVFTNGNLTPTSAPIGLIGNFYTELLDSYGNDLWGAPPVKASVVAFQLVSTANPDVPIETYTASIENGGVSESPDIHINTPGTYEMIVSDGFDTPAISSPFTVTAPASASPAPATHLVFLTQPPSTANGNLGDISIAVEDDFGNIITSNNSTVNLNISTGGKISGSTSIHVKNGIATFHNLTIQNGGYFHLTATDKNLTSAVSSSFINEAHLSVLSQSTSIVAGNNASFTVALETTYNRIVSIDGATLTLTLSSAPAGVVTGTTYTAQTTAGRATFSIPLTKTGNYIFTASDGSAVTVAKSRTLNVIPAAPASLQFINPPSSLFTFGGPLPKITVGIYDQYNNLVTNQKAVITLATPLLSNGQPVTYHATTVNGVATFPSTGGIGAFTATSGNLTVTFTNALPVLIPFPNPPFPWGPIFPIQPIGPITVLG